ncbi:MAG: OB-fold nucleic acid binding domain-containing protein [Pseudomonadota bacterium]
MQIVPKTQRGASRRQNWPRPPHVVPNAQLEEVPNGARIAVAGLVLVRQRPGTAKGVIFITLEDETGIVNVIVWRAKYEEFRRAVIAGRCLRVTGRLQREGPITHLIAETVEDISWMLDDLLRERPVAATVHQPCTAADQP